MNAAGAFLIVGLGNPGAQYVGTRHNMGFRTVDLFAAQHNIEFDRKEKLYWSGLGNIGTHDVVLLKPRTYMNLSGNAVLSMCTRYGFKPPQIIVISDDFCLPLGRVRLGVGAPDTDGGDPIDFVLGTFRPEEYEPINELISRASEAISYIIECGPDAAMNKFN